MNAILNVTDARAHFSEVVEHVSRGEDVIITRLGKPVARITRYEPAVLIAKYDVDTLTS